MDWMGGSNAHSTPTLAHGGGLAGSSGGGVSGSGCFDLADLPVVGGGTGMMTMMMPLGVLGGTSLQVEQVDRPPRAVLAVRSSTPVQWVVDSWTIITSAGQPPASHKQKTCVMSLQLLSARGGVDASGGGGGGGGGLSLLSARGGGGSGPVGGGGYAELSCCF